MPTLSRKKEKKPRNQKRLYKRDEQEPTNRNLPREQKAKQGPRQNERGGTGSADPKFDQTKPLSDDWGKSDKY